MGTFESTMIIRRACSILKVIVTESLRVIGILHVVGCFNIILDMILTLLIHRLEEHVLDLSFLCQLELIEYTLSQCFKVKMAII